MGDKTGIQWTEATWNPVAGCTVVSPGCTNCYAMKDAARIVRMGGKGAKKYVGLTRDSKGGPVWTGDIRIADDDTFAMPLRWRRPRGIFVNSMSDLFHTDVPFVVAARVWWVIGQCAGFLDPSRTRGHRFQILTKRSARMAEFLAGWANTEIRRGWIENLYEQGRGEVFDWMNGPAYWPDVFPNLTIGFSAENQERFDARWADLRHLAGTGWTIMVSVEPCLGSIRLPPDFLALGHRGWVIVGGESGPKARLMPEHCVLPILHQCRDAGVPFYLKQLGTAMAAVLGLRHPKGGEPAEWPEDLRVREFPGMAR
ncbi:DUF5131 family protein [Azospirillum sp. RWY-5-1]|uniref:DUF5131 family protein n=1 Tax=Azospirillum oleiclasticum TaxID=2735135 RepID=A0ABX2TA59_9PROT|nr:DUF5131 family protein [Azospirillum oleiclasticum]NYZ12868.1 DUF5131 family protein [Azospirillum oleiclasticum]NYZ20028.1 DUF5131 family protein [Azospirillum oleiclasticum]